MNPFICSITGQVLLVIIRHKDWSKNQVNISETYSLELIERHHENSAVVEGGQPELKESN